jgi:hypothetical protein
VETNPYQSPASPSAVPATSLAWQVFLKLIAVGFWVAAVLWSVLGVGVTFLAATEYTGSLSGYWGTLICAFVLPVSALALFGAACWWRSVRFAIFGLLPIATEVLVYIVVIISN